MNLQLVIVGIRRALVVCVVLLIVFSTPALAGDFFQDTFDICNKVLYSVEVYDVVKGYNNSYVTKEKALELLNGARNLAFEKLTYWYMLYREEWPSFRSLEEAVSDFFCSENWCNKLCNLYY